MEQPRNARGDRRLFGSCPRPAACSCPLGARLQQVRAAFILMIWWEKERLAIEEELLRFSVPSRGPPRAGPVIGCNPAGSFYALLSKRKSKFVRPCRRFLNSETHSWVRRGRWRQSGRYDNITRHFMPARVLKMRTAGQREQVLQYGDWRVAWRRGRRSGRELGCFRRRFGSFLHNEHNDR